MHAKKNQITVVALRVVVFAAVALLLCSGSAWAQTTDVFKTTYFDNNGVTGAPAAFIHVANPGLGALCADIYVWRADQELEECCSCPISNNGLLTFTVGQATANPGDGTPTPPTSGSIDIIADSSTSCTDSSAAASPTPTPTLRAWATHVNADSTGVAELAASAALTENVYDVTETPFSDAALSSGEMSEAATRCAAILANGSGHGICDAICTATADSVRAKTK